MSAEAFPGRKRDIHNLDKLVTNPDSSKEETNGTYALASMLEAGQWSVDHNAEIVNIFNTPDGAYRVVLNNGIEIPLDRDDGLVIR